MSTSTDPLQTGAPSGYARIVAATAGLLTAVAAGAAVPACLLDASPYESEASGGPGGSAGSGRGTTTSTVTGGGATASTGGAGGDGGATSGTGAMGGGSTTSTTGTTTSTPPTTTSTGGPPCQSGCYDCAIASLEGGGACNTQAMACAPDGTCKGFADCIGATCGTDWCAPEFNMCQQTCLAGYPGTLTDQLVCCVENACAIECGFTPCP
jgi:hypothetical protein